MFQKLVRYLQETSNEIATLRPCSASRNFSCYFVSLSNLQFSIVKFFFVASLCSRIGICIQHFISLFELQIHVSFQIHVPFLIHVSFQIFCIFPLSMNNSALKMRWLWTTCGDDMEKGWDRMKIFKLQRREANSDFCCIAALCSS